MPFLEKYVRPMARRLGIAAGGAGRGGSGSGSGGGTLAVPTIDQVYGPGCMDIRTFGALPGYYEAQTTWNAIQAAIDSVPKGGFGYIYVPYHVDGYWVHRPIMADRHIHFVGPPGGMGIANLCTTGDFPLILVGVSRKGPNDCQPLEPPVLDGVSGTAFTGLYLDSRTYTDLAAPSATGVSSATRPFVASDAGRMIAIFSGTGFTPGAYRIQSVSNGVATIGAHATQGSTGGSWSFGAEHAFIWCSPFSHGRDPSVNGNLVDAYEYGPNFTREITIEFLLDLGNKPLQPGPLMGMCDVGPKPAPFVLSLQANPGQPASNLRIMISIEDGSKYGQMLSCNFVIPTNLTGLNHYCVTSSPLQGKNVCWVNQTQMDTVPGYNAMPPVGSQFQENPGVGFMIGGEKGNPWNFDPSFETAAPQAGYTVFTPMNRNIKGLRFWGSAPYDLTKSAGSQQTRLDGHPIDPSTPGSRYFTQEPGVLAWIPFSDAPANVLANRMFTVNCATGNGTSYAPVICGYLMSNNNEGFDWCRGSVQNLTCKSAGIYSPTIGIGWVQEYVFKDSAFYGGMYSVGMIPAGSSYTVRMEGLNQIFAKDIGIFLVFCDFKADGKLTFGNYGRGLIKSVSSSSMQIEEMYVASASGQSKFPVYATAYLSLQTIVFDVEGINPAIRSIIRVDTVKDVPTGAICLIGGLGIGALPPQASMILIDGSDNDMALGSVKLDNYSTTASKIHAVIETNAFSMTGTIEETLGNLSAPIVKNTNSQGLSGIRSIQRPDSFVRMGSYSTHSSEIIPRYPVAGQFTKFLCYSQGDYRTAPTTGNPNPAPTWFGLNPLDLSNGGDIAAYCQMNFALSCGNSGTIEAPVSNYIASLFLNAFFGGVNMNQASIADYINYGTLPAGVPSPFATVMAGLSTDVVGPSDWYAVVGEVAAAGYSRQTPVFGASSGGVISNSATITFPAMGSDQTITGVPLFDSATGIHFGTAPVDPLFVPAGTPVSFAPGTLKIQAVPVPALGVLGPRLGYIAPSVLDAFNNFIFRRVALSPPTGLQYALSTAPAGLGAPAEPSGNGYSRPSAGAFTLAAPPYPLVNLRAGKISGEISNATARSFGTPTGNWGTRKSVALLDGSGAVMMSSNVTIPAAIGLGSPAQVISPGAFLIHA